MFNIRGIFRIVSFAVFFLSTQIAFGQSAGGGFPTPLIVGLIAFIVVIMLLVVVMVADRLMKISAEQTGAVKTGENYSIFPTWKEIFNSDKTPTYVGEAGVTKLTKGFDISLEGEANEIIEEVQATRYALKPTDFKDLSPIPKVMVELESSVKAGDPIFFDKKKPEVKFAAPVSGEVIAVTRGEKRRITEVVILADKDQTYREYDVPSLDAGREELVAFLLESGVWPFIKQRPYNTLANHKETPRDIFISTFDTAPLAPNNELAIKGNEAAFQKGLDVLAKLTEGSVYLGLNANAPTETAFNAFTGVKKNWFSGAHPAGNVGIQIHHTAPINKGDTVWTMDVNGVIILGRLFNEGKFDTTRLVALTGAELVTTKYVKTQQGASVSDLLTNNLANDHVRIISGDVLTGEKVSEESFVSFHDDQVTVVEEGDYYEMFGWLLPIKPRPSISGTFPKLLYPEKMKADTNTHGEHRAFVVTGQYESVLPMDIYPQHLLKAILVNDFERMEGLGIYEVVEEDMALCEFVCTSKQHVQQILRDGINKMIEQG